MPAPWETSFEDGFCGYERAAGFCYSDDGSTFRLVTAPVHTGPFAAAFDIGLDEANDERQARCVREGILPEAAYYGAWYYIPSGSSDPVNWNLFHFRGGEPGGDLSGTWDVSIDQRRDGLLSLMIRDNRARRAYRQAEPIALPTDRWFHLEFFLRRSARDTGEVALFQDGEELVRVTDVVTDLNPFTQWYVGNLTYAITPARSTVYVDDVSIRLDP